MGANGCSKFGTKVDEWKMKCFSACVMRSVSFKRKGYYHSYRKRRDNTPISLNMIVFDFLRISRLSFSSMSLWSVTPPIRWEDNTLMYIWYKLCRAKAIEWRWSGTLRRVMNMQMRFCQKRYSVVVKHKTKSGFE